jgi:hypothetical protein
MEVTGISLASFWCWASLLVTVIGLLVSFYFTNRNAFPYRRDQDESEARQGIQGPSGERPL